MVFAGEGGERYLRWNHSPDVLIEAGRFNKLLRLKFFSVNCVEICAIEGNVSIGNLQVGKAFKIWKEIGPIKNKKFNQVKLDLQFLPQIQHGAAHTAT